MKVLIDECVPSDLKLALAEHGFECDTAREAGLGSKKNGELLAIAEGRWDVLVTTDKNIKFQRNLTGRIIAIVVLRARTNRLADLLPLLLECASALRRIRPGEILEVGSP